MRFYILFFFQLILFYSHTNLVKADSFESSYWTKKIKLKYKNDSLKIYLHFPWEKKGFAKKSEKIIKDDFKKIHEYFDYLPQADLHIVVAESFEASANGAAGVFPRNSIYLHDFPPMGEGSLAVSSDWLKILLIHEYIHILTIEMTHGVSDFFRNFLGSVTKLVQFSPRWFLEGIAVWGESYFTKEGRVRSSKILYNVKKTLSKRKNCQDPLCLDDPGHYPYGQMSYWVGGLFLDHLEKRKSGTMKCLMDFYSRGFPVYSLSNAFKACTKLNLRSSFYSFKKSLKEKKISTKSWCKISDLRLCEKLSNKYTDIDWFKGSVENKSFIGLVNSPNRRSQSVGENGDVLIIYNKESKKIKKYRFKTRIEQVYSLNSKKTDLIVSSLVNIKGVDTRLFHSYNSMKKKFSKINLPDKKRDQCHLYLGKNKNNVFCLKYSQSHWNLISFAKGDGSDLLHHSFRHLEKITPENIDIDNNIFDFRDDNKELIKASLANKKERESEKSSNKKSNYNGFKYLMPEYLLLDFYVGGLTSSFGLATTFNDPLNRHNFNLAGYYNFEIDEKPYSGTLGYLYNRGTINTGFSYGRYISKASNDEFLVSESVNAFFRHSTFFDRTKWTKGFSVSKIDEKDFIGNKRDFLNLRLSNTLTYKSLLYSNLLNSYSLNLTPGVIKNSSSDSFLTVRASSNLGLRFSDRARLNTNIDYGKYFTDSFSDGVIFGGGLNGLLFNQFSYTSYLIPFGLIYGQEMLSGQIKYEYDLFDFYKTYPGLTLLYKNLSILGGVEYIQSDVLRYIEGSGELDPRVSSVFLGLKSDLRLFYILPLSVELTFSASNNEQYASGLSLVLGSDIRF